jgi:hypothetical protein
MDKKETMINIFVHSRSKIYCSGNMLDLSSLDEADLAGYTGEI